MNIDERARAAATNLLDRASDRPVPAVHELDRPSRPRRRLVLAAAAAVLVLGGLALVATRDDDTVRTITTLPTPRGIEAKTWSPLGLGITLAVPSTWEERGPHSGFAHVIGDPGNDGHVVADRLRNVAGLDADAVGANRAADLQALGARDIETDDAVIDGRQAAMLTYRLRSPDDAGVSVSITEYDIAEGDWFYLVAVGEQVPADRSEVTEWIGSTLQVRPLTAEDLAFSVGLGHPTSPLAPPAGVEPKLWAPEGLGATLQVPSTWLEVPSAGGFTIRLAPGPVILASRRSSPGLVDRRRSELEELGAVIESVAETTVDGRPATAMRYWMAPAGYPLRVVRDIEYVIEVGDDEAILITLIENDGGDDHGPLLRWIRSTVDVA